MYHYYTGVTETDVVNTLVKTNALPTLITKSQNENDTNPPFMGVDVTFIEKEENNEGNKSYKSR